MILKNDLIQKGKPLTHADIKLVHPAHHIKDGRSAYELWRKIFAPNIPEKILAQINSNKLFKGFNPDEAIPELNSQFDNYGKGRQHDLFAIGKCNSGKKLAIGVESKVDEPFDNKTAKEYRASGAARIKSGKNSFKAQRIKDLIDALFVPTQYAAAENIKYQLIQATAGVLAEAKMRNADYALFVIHNLTPAAKGKLYTFKNAQNTKDLDDFISVFSDGKYSSLPLHTLIGPLLVKGNIYIPNNTPLYFLKVEDIF